MNTHSRAIFLSLFLVGLVLNLLTVVTWDLSLVSNDGIQYMSTAGNWLAGNGFATDALIYAPHFQGVLPAIQTVWPPGYPFAIALTSKLGVDLKTAAFMLNLIMHATASLIMWRIILKTGVDRFFATLCAFAFYFMAMPWMYVSAGLTEPLFTCLILGSLLVLPEPKRSNLLTWITCGLLIAACIFVRYSSVFVAFGTGIGIFIYMLVYLPESERNSFSALLQPGSKLALLISLPTAAFAYLMYRTYEVVGTLDRYSGSKVPQSLTSTAKLWLSKSSDLLGFSNDETTSGLIATASFLLFGLLVLMIVVIFLAGDENYLKRSFNPSGQNTRTTYLRLATLVTMFHALSLIIYLSINSVRTTPLEIITRYLYQLYPTLYAIFCYMLFALLKQNGVGKKHTAIQIISTVIVALYFIAQVNSVKVSRDIYFRDALISSEMLELQANDSASIKDFIKNCFSNDQIGKSLWSPHAQPLHLHTGLPTITLIANYTDKPFSADTFKQRIKQYDIGMFVFVDFLDEPNVNHEKYMNTTKAWLSKNGYAEVPLKETSFGLNRSVEIYSSDPHCDS